MNRVFQINIVQAENGFVVQSPTGDQMIAKDETELQEAVKSLALKLITAPEPVRGGTQTTKRFGKQQIDIRKSA